MLWTRILGAVIGLRNWDGLAIGISVTVWVAVGLATGRWNAFTFASLSAHSLGCAPDIAIAALVTRLVLHVG